MVVVTLLLLPVFCLSIFYFSLSGGLSRLYGLWSQSPLLLAENGDIFVLRMPTYATVGNQPANEISNNLICILSYDDKVSVSQLSHDLFIWDIAN